MIPVSHFVNIYKLIGVIGCWIPEFAIHRDIYRISVTGYERSIKPIVFGNIKRKIRPRGNFYFGSSRLELICVVGF